MREKSSVEVTLDNTDFQVSKGTTIADCFVRANLDIKQPKTDIIASRINNEFASLTDTVFINCRMEPVYIYETAGKRIYKDSLIFLFGMAAQQVFPNRRIAAAHSMGHGMLFHFQDDGNPANKNDISIMEQTMRDIVKKDFPITSHRISWDDAVEYFQKKQCSSTALLLRERNEPSVSIWNCGEYASLRYAPLINRTGAYHPFSIELFDGGFLLEYVLPNQMQKPDITGEKLYKVYKEHRKWGRILGISNVSSLNILAGNRHEVRDFIRTSEALQERKMVELAASLASKSNRAIMIAGPSSSGKTTFTKKLALNLKSLGMQPQLISLDDYYKKREDIPLNEKEEPDFEALEALNLNLLSRNIQDLLAGKKTEIPIKDFKIDTGATKGRVIQMRESGILLFEGLHGLNPNLLPTMDKASVARIYISPLAQLNLDDYVRIPLADIRLLRRIVRDHHYRRCTALDTLRIWPSVRRGEERYIFPWQGVADYFFDTALDYELFVLKVFASPLLHSVSPDEKEYGEARRLITLLRNLASFPAEEVPELSIVREFIGRSGFRY